MKDFIARTLTTIALLVTLAILAYPTLAQSTCLTWSATDASDQHWTITACPDNATTTVTPTPLGTPTNTPATPGTTPTATPTAPPTTPPSGSTSGLWISAAEVKQLPMSGPGWGSVQSLASGSGTPDLSNQDSEVNAIVMAKALEFSRLDGIPQHQALADQRRSEVVAAIRSIVENQSESGGRTLALGRELAAYVVAADLIDLREFDPALHNRFKARLTELRSKTLDSRTLISTHEDRANNWGTHAGASRAAVDVYIGDRADLDRTFAVFCGWAGERSRYSGFKFGGLEWQSDKANPVGINPVGGTIQGHDVSGALPEELRRAGGFKWPPGQTNYVWGGLAGAAAQAHILARAGYPAWECADRAMLRAAQFAYRTGFDPTGDDVSVPPLIAAAYGVDLPSSGFEPSKNFCCTGWTHGSAVAASDILFVDDTHQTATGETEGELDDEVEYLKALGWQPVGEVRELTTDDGVVLAQDMLR